MTAAPVVLVALGLPLPWMAECILDFAACLLPLQVVVIVGSRVVVPAESSTPPRSLSQL